MNLQTPKSGSPAGGAKRRFEIIPEVYKIGGAIQDAGGRAVLVGGWVRDAMLGIPHRQDFDLEVFGLPIRRLQKVLANMGAVHLVGRHFGVLKLKTRKAEYDVSVPRRESNIGKGHKGFQVDPDPDMTFEEAAARRDFTINAMGYDFLADTLLDPVGGQEDLRKGLLRHVGPAFAEDPLRVLRAMQFAGRFAFQIDPATLGLCRELDLNELPRERVWEEIKKLLLQAARPSQGFQYAAALGITDLLPELGRLHAAPAAKGEAGPWAFTMAMLDHAAALREAAGEEARVLMTAALCVAMDRGPGAPEASSGPGCPEAVVTFLARLTNETRFVDKVCALLADLPTVQRLHDQRGGETQGAVRRLAGRISIPFLLLGAETLHRTRFGEAPFPAGEWLAGRAKELGVWKGPPQPILKGRHLKERGFPDGREMGRLLKEAFELQLDGELTTLSEALAWAESQRKGGGKPDGKDKPAVAPGGRRAGARGKR